MKTVPVILAGGIGERFWPASKSTFPKQLLKLAGDTSVLETTIDRVAPLCKEEVKPLLITGKNIVPALKKVIPASKAFDIIVEPVGKNTAPAIGLAAAWIQKKYGDAVMVVVSADHAIKPVTAYLKAVSAAVKLAKRDSLVVFGITPERPDTGYGYIQVKDGTGAGKGVTTYTVDTFVEKPTLEKAKKYVKSKSYLWNSGMFVWKTSIILAEYEKSLPEMFKQIKAVEQKKFSKKAVEEFYANAQSISIDYGIMEHARRVSAVAGTFTWDDIGAWEAIFRLNEKDAAGNVTVGSSIAALKCKDTLVFNQSAISVATLGLDNVSVIVADGVVLVVNRDHLPELKASLAEIRKSRKLPENLF